MSRRQSSRNFLQIDTPDRNSCDVYRRCGPSAAESTPFRFTAGPGELAISGWPLGTVIDWGDGTTTTVTAATTTHTYIVGGSGSVPGAPTDGRVFGPALLGVTDWGDGLFAASFAFSHLGNNAPNLTSVPDSVPSGITNMMNMFAGATVFNSSNVSGWDVSNVTTMDSMFVLTENFNVDISGWDVSNTVNLEYMFELATAFNQDLSSWCVSQFPVQPDGFSDGATAWTLPKPEWGTCP